jgi:hypothetical protein
MTHEPEVVMVSVKRAGKIASYEIHGARVLVGSGSHCDVRLYPEDAAPEQLVISCQNGELSLQLLAAAMSGKLDGRPLPQLAALPPSSVLQLGGSELQARTTIRQARNAGARKDEGWPPALRALGIGLILVGGYFALQDPPAPSALDRSLEQPPLFAAPVRDCPPRGDDSADFHAGRLIRDANLKSERAPYFPRDGVAAVTLYEQAAACFERLGIPVEAKAAEASAERLRHTLSDEFHVRHVRLERLLNVKKYDAAQRELQVLQDFVARSDGPYAQWLAAVQREINARFAHAPKKG